MNLSTYRYSIYDIQRHRLTPFKHSQSKQDENIEELTR